MLSVKFKELKIGTIGTLAANIPFLIVGFGRPKGVILAAQHGGELSGLFVIADMLKQIKGLIGQAVIVPITNPFGQIFGQRNEVIDGKDLNHQFPGRENGDFTARLANQLLKLCNNADFVIDLHTFSRQTPIVAGFTLDKAKNQAKIIKMINALQPDLAWAVDMG